MREVCAPLPPCPSVVAVLREQRATLNVYAFDGVSGTAACARGESVEVTAYLDGVPVGRGEIPCVEELRVPPASVRIRCVEVVAGLHEVRIEAKTARGKIESSTLMSLPAFDITDDARAITVGAEIAVTVGPDDLAIGPPQVYPPRGL